MEPISWDQAITAFADGSRFFGGDPWLKTVAEFAPLFLPPIRDRYPQHSEVQTT